MIQLSDNFSLEELTTTDVHDLDNTPSPTLLPILRDTAENMEIVRTILNSHAIHVNSGYRSVEVNHRVGGVPSSAHIFGWAVDFLCPAFGPPLAVCRKLSSTPSLLFDQLIMEGTWTHISFAPNSRREVLTRTSTGYTQGLPHA